MKGTSILCWVITFRFIFSFSQNQMKLLLFLCCIVLTIRCRSKQKKNIRFYFILVTQIKQGKKQTMEKCWLNFHNCVVKIYYCFPKRVFILTYGMKYCGLLSFFLYLYCCYSKMRMIQFVLQQHEEETKKECNFML